MTSRRPDRAPTTGSCSTTTTSAPARPALALAAGRACTGRAASTTTTRSPGPTRTWTGRPLPGAILYELHIGTFTPEGTFDAAIERLDHLVDLGVDLVELLPVAAFNGEHGWGYDGVCWFAPHEPYGGPDGLKRFVDAAHARGLGVVLDVVYNHFGPSGAYAPMFGPYLRERANRLGPVDQPRRPAVRRGPPYIVDSALSWLRDYHVDGLRLDAVHALVDRRAVHLLEELAVEVDALSTQLGRPLTLIAESDLNDPRHVTAARGRRLRPARPVGRRLPPRRCTRCSPASGRATTPTSARRSAWPPC